MIARKRNTRRRTRTAFTLLEILLVVGLLALLAAFAIPNLINSGETAKKDMVKAAIGSNGTMSQSIDYFKFATGVYPEALKDLVEKPSDDEIAEKWAGPYLKDLEMLKDPWGREFNYSPQGSHNEGSYDLWSTGPDGIDGNEDDITNWKDDR